MPEANIARLFIDFAKALKLAKLTENDVKRPRSLPSPELINKIQETMRQAGTEIAGTDPQARIEFLKGMISALHKISNSIAIIPEIKLDYQKQVLSELDDIYERNFKIKNYTLKNEFSLARIPVLKVADLAGNGSQAFSDLLNGFCSLSLTSVSEKIDVELDGRLVKAELGARMEIDPGAMKQFVIDSVRSEDPNADITKKVINSAKEYLERNSQKATIKNTAITLSFSPYPGLDDPNISLDSQNQDFSPAEQEAIKKFGAELLNNCSGRIIFSN